MEKQIYTCPSCGGALELKYRFSKMAVCSHCSQASFLENGNLTLAGSNTELANYGSKFSLGAQGHILGSKFEIIGRIRFEYVGGFWDEWLIRIAQQENSEHWIHEDEGDLILFAKEPLPSKISYESLKVGSLYDFSDKKIFPTEKNNAQILGSEGELPFKVLPSQQADFIDGIFYGKGNVFNYKFMPEETFFYSGKFIKWNDIVIEDVENSY